MKRLTIFSLTVLLLFSLFSCSGKEQKKKKHLEDEIEFFEKKSKKLKKKTKKLKKSAEKKYKKTLKELSK